MLLNNLQYGIVGFLINSIAYRLVAGDYSDILFPITFVIIMVSGLIINHVDRSRRGW